MAHERAETCCWDKLCKKHLSIVYIKQVVFDCILPIFCNRILTVKEPPNAKIKIIATRTCVIVYMFLLIFWWGCGGRDFICFCTLAAFSKIHSVLRIKTCTSNEAGNNLLISFKCVFRRNCKTLYEFIIQISGCVGDDYEGLCLPRCDAVRLYK